MKPGFTALPFKMGRGAPQALVSTPVVDLGAIGFGVENLVEIRTNASGAVYAASAVKGTPDIFDQNTPAYTYIIGTENYDGLRRMYNLRQNRWPQIYAPYVAETPSGHFCHIGYKAEVASEFAGFQIHFDAFGNTDLEITLHSAKGSAYNSLLWSKDLSGIQDDSYMYNPPIFLGKGDRLDLTYAAAGIFTTILYVRKLA